MEQLVSLREGTFVFKDALTDEESRAETFVPTTVQASRKAPLSTADSRTKTCATRAMLFDDHVDVEGARTHGADRDPMVWQPDENAADEAATSVGTDRRC